MECAATHSGTTQRLALARSADIVARVEATSDAGAAASADDVLAFWFGDAPRDTDDVKRCMRHWFGGSAECDRVIRERFERLIAPAAANGLPGWLATARGRLALIVLLDQFPRNIYRGTAAAFAYDSAAREIARAGIDAAVDRQLAPLERMFFYLPLEHSESLADQERAVSLFAALAEVEAPPYLRVALQGSLDYARQHRDIIARFGRFPHRNAVLGRRNTDSETAFLEQGGPTFGQPATP